MQSPGPIPNTGNKNLKVEMGVGAYICCGHVCICMCVYAYVALSTEARGIRYPKYGTDCSESPAVGIKLQSSAGAVHALNG